MGDITIMVVLGHFVGDYLLQNDWMALNKKERSWPCFVHCVIYTLCICLFVLPQCELTMAWWPFVMLIFLSHIVLDGTGLIEWWLHLIGGRSFQRLKGPCTSLDARTTRLIYTCIVQTIADNTVHLCLMYYIVITLLKGKA